MRTLLGRASATYDRDRALFPTILFFGVVLVLIQWAGGAWTAEFDGYPDEASQFVTGRMIWQYLRVLPKENWISWAAQYYIHYPKVAVGKWPPGYHIAEALWSLPFGSSRISAMWLQWLLGLTALFGLYMLVRRQMPLWVTWGILAFAVASPVFQEGLQQTMSELGCLLCAILFMHAVVRLLESPDRLAISSVFIAFAAAALTKGTAVSIAPVPVIAALATGRGFPWRSFKWQLIAGALVLIACLLWFAFTTDVAYWGGMTGSLPWPIPKLPRLAGWGFLIVAALGVTRQPLAVVSASMIASAIAVSWFVRAMNEPRHWIMVLPAVLILSGYALTRSRPLVRGFVLVPAVLLFPWVWYHQIPTGYVDFLRQLPLPARMLISSGYNSGEGAWITEVSINERYPGSVVMRATKILSELSWNGEDYRLLVHSSDEVKKRLDELAINLVILDAPALFERPDQALLKNMLENSPDWKIRCGTERLLAYQRLKPPAFSRKPIVLNAGHWHIEEEIPRQTPR